MFEIEQNKTKEKIKIKGKVYELSPWCVGHSMQFADFGKEMEDGDASSFKKCVDLVESLGVPSDVIKGLTTDEFLKLMNYMSDGDKREKNVSAQSK